MTAKEMVRLAKEKLGRDITEEQARAYLDSTEQLPDEMLDAVSGGAQVTPEEREAAAKAGREWRSYGFNPFSM